MSRNGNPLGPFAWIISKTIRDRSNMSIAKMLACQNPGNTLGPCTWIIYWEPHWEEQSINRVFHSSLPGSRVIVADATQRCRGMEIRRDLVLELFREPLEIDQIIQLHKCSPHWEEQSINRVFHFSMPGSRVIVADATKRCRDATKRCRGMETCWDLVLELFREWKPDRSNMSIAKMLASFGNL